MAPPCCRHVPGRRVSIRCRWYGAPVRLLMIYLTLRFDLIFVVPRVRSRPRNPRYRRPIWSPPAYPGRPACCCCSMPLLGPPPLPVLLPRTSALPCRLHRRRPDGSTRLQPRRPLQSAYSRCCCHGGTGDVVILVGCCGGSTAAVPDYPTASTPAGRRCSCNPRRRPFIYTTL
jgi:hypothetical protein